MNRGLSMFDIHNRRYTGSKYKLQDWIFDLVRQNCRGQSFADLFAGTGVITSRFMADFNKLIVNDLLFSNWVVYKAFFENRPMNQNALNKYALEFQQCSKRKIRDNYVSRNFGGKFFNLQDARVIGDIREQIENLKPVLSDKEYYVLLASLLYSADKSANTVGHYDAYIRHANIDSCFKFELINPIKTSHKKFEIYREDANRLVKHIKADICYIDPPYNSRQYSRFYHVLENLAEWEKPKLYGVAMKPRPQKMSEYSRVSAPIVFADLITNLQAKYVVVSYNNTYDSKSSSSRNKITLEEIQDILASKGKVKQFSTKHAFFNTGKTDFSNHQELLFITEVKK